MFRLNSLSPVYTVCRFGVLCLCEVLISAVDEPQLIDICRLGNILVLVADGIDEKGQI